MDGCLHVNEGGTLCMGVSVENEVAMIAINKTTISELKR